MAQRGLNMIMYFCHMQRKSHGSPVDMELILSYLVKKEMRTNCATQEGFSMLPSLVQENTFLLFVVLKMGCRKLLLHFDLFQNLTLPVFHRLIFLRYLKIGKHFFMEILI